MLGAFYFSEKFKPMITKENIIDILYDNSYNVQDQAGNNLIVVDDDDWGKVADAIIALENSKQ